MKLTSVAMSKLQICHCFPRNSLAPLRPVSPPAVDWHRDGHYNVDWHE